ncbi:hypothetical protein [Vibrio jasicida]|uniref:hypothetical protein n=1 Tax=Vibrio jasicida TaxID=766224 RepID=UPI001CA5B8D6|nr:hypothetical protein [Vibrio jasicida]
MSSSHVLLEGKIHSSSQDVSNIVTSVSPVTELESCNDISFDSTSYTVNFDDFVGVCVYKYDAQNSKDPEQKASAYAISIAQKSVDSEVDLFAPISDTTLVGEPLTIDLKNDPNFVTQVPDGYTMDQQLTLIGGGEATADNTNQTITYNPSDEGGFAKIIFSYSNGSEIKLGNIAISVSSSPNTAPNAPDIDLSHDPDAGRVNINQEVIIDLAKYVSDDDGDALQLIYTDSWNAAVSPLDPQDMNNLKLRFETTKVGEHFVSYAVSDHYGGYAMGLIRIEVYDSGVAASWGNLQLDMSYYFAPLVKSDADAQGIAYTSSHIDTEANGANVATFNLLQAKDMCAASGRLPTQDELIALSKIAGVGPAAYDGWPVEVDYWALDSGSASIVNLKSGQTTQTPNAGGQYVTCIGEGGYLIDTAQSKLVAIGDGVDQASVAVKATFNGEPLAGITVEAAVTGSANLANTSLETDAAGYAIFTIVDAISEQVTFETNIENSTSTRSAQLHFTGNPNTADLQLVSVMNNQPLTGENVFSATLTDAAGSPVAGQVIDYTHNPDVKYNPVEEQTDQDGQQTVSVQLINQGTESYGYIVEAEYTRPDGSISNAQLPMVFVANILSASLGSDKDWAQAPDQNLARAHFKVDDGTQKQVQFNITTGNAVFKENHKKMMTYTATHGNATAHIVYDGDYSEASATAAYRVKASFKGQSTNELVQHFHTGVAGKQNVYKQVSLSQPEPEGWSCPQSDGTWHGPQGPETGVSIAQDLQGVPYDLISSIWTVDETVYDGRRAFGLTSRALMGSYSNVLYGTPGASTWTENILLNASISYRICRKPRT